mmetsp:Transcript_28079/g.71159  ORF Transcript_28079/g.71159 Transcript_28079/m.71159 type:complete len:375 (+) Transcript_28079:1587-2711(+)
MSSTAFSCCGRFCCATSNSSWRSASRTASSFLCCFNSCHPASSARRSRPTSSRSCRIVSSVDRFHSFTRASKLSRASWKAAACFASCSACRAFRASTSLSFLRWNSVWIFSNCSRNFRSFSACSRAWSFRTACSRLWCSSAICIFSVRASASSCFRKTANASSCSRSSARRFASAASLSCATDCSRLSRCCSSSASLRRSSSASLKRLLSAASANCAAKSSSFSANACCISSSFRWPFSAATAASAANSSAFVASSASRRRSDTPAPACLCHFRNTACSSARSADEECWEAQYRLNSSILVRTASATVCCPRSCISATECSTSRLALDTVHRLRHSAKHWLCRPFSVEAATRCARETSRVVRCSSEICRRLRAA